MNAVVWRGECNKSPKCTTDPSRQTDALRGRFANLFGKLVLCLGRTCGILPFGGQMALAIYMRVSEDPTPKSCCILCDAASISEAVVGKRND